MKSLIFKAAAVLAIVCASFAFTAKGPLRVISCDIPTNTCKIVPQTFQPGTGIHFDQATFNEQANGKSGCAANCNDQIDVAPQI